MEFREERWFVRFRGQTLGPLSGDQVRAALRKNELSRDDKIASSREPAWITISAHPLWGQVSVGGLSALKPLPSPQKLLQKKRAPLPKATAVAPVIDITPIKVTTADPAPAYEREPAPLPMAAAEPVPEPIAETTPLEAKPATIAAKTSRGLRPARKRKAKEKPALVAEELVAQPAPNPAPVPSPAASPVPLALAADPRPRELPAPSPDTNHLPVATDDPSWRLFASAPAPQLPAAAVSAGPLGPEAHSLMESLRAWEEEERVTDKEKVALAKPTAMLTGSANRPTSALEDMPDRPVFHFPREENPAPTREPAAHADPAVRRIELHLSASKQFLVMISVLTALALAAAVYFFAFANKTRGPADSRLPDPSSPTIQPSEPGDPTPALKAPTRPRRD